MLFVVILCALAPALTGWYALTTSGQSHGQPGDRPTTNGFMGPDAQERNEQFRQAREKTPEATHGH